MHFGDKFLASIVAACVVGIGVGVFLTYNVGRVEPSSKAFDDPATVEPIAPRPAAPSAPELGAHTVEKVIAPNIVVLSDLGPVHLLGIATTAGPDGKASDPDRAIALLQQIAVGKSVMVMCDPATADTEFKDENGVYLVYLMRDDGVIVNTELVARGGAVADLDHPATRRDEMVRAERDARWNNRGLWEVASAKPAGPVAPSTLLPDPRRSPSDAGGSVAPGKNDVLVTKDGRFHRSSCPESKGGVVMSIEDARAKHYLACPRCFASPKVKI